MAYRRFLILVLTMVTINMNGQGSFISLPPISDHTDLLTPYHNNLQAAIDGFFEETNIEVFVVTSYRFAQKEPFEIRNLWKESASSSLLITINLHEDTFPLEEEWDWWQNVDLTATLNVESILPMSLLTLAKSEVMLPILDELLTTRGRILGTPEKYAEAIIQALDFLMEKRDNNFFLINGDKYFNGTTAYFMQKGEEALTIQAFKANGEVFPANTEWDGIPTQGNGNEANLYITEPSIGPNGELAKASFFESNEQIELSIKVVVVQVTFEAAWNQEFGFDDNPKYLFELSKYFCYPSYATTPYEGLPWKTLKPNTTDKLLVKIEPKGVEDRIYFLSDDPNMTLSPQQPTSATQILSVTALGTINNANIKVQIGNPDEGESTYCKVRTYTPLLKRLLLVNVGATIPSSDLDEITSTVTRIYRESLVDFEKLELFPFNLDAAQYLVGGQLPVPNGNQYSPEMISLYENCEECKKKVELEGYQIVFLINVPTDRQSVLGRMINDQYGFVFVTSHGDESIADTASHEFGHGAFALRHPWAEFDRSRNTQVNLPCDYSHPVADLDQFNIMGYGNGHRKRFRKYQWDQIHNQ